MKHSLAVAALAFLAGCVSIEDGGGGTRAFQSQSPTAMGTAIFTKEVGPQDSAVNFEVIDPKIGAQPLTVGFVGDANWKGQMPRAAVWSKDGSVIAVRGADFVGWSHAYDFKAHNFALSDVYPLKKRADSIEKLLKSRGGPGPKVLNDWAQFDQFARPVAQSGR